MAARLWSIVLGVGVVACAAHGATTEPHVRDDDVALRTGADDRGELPDEEEEEDDDDDDRVELDPTRPPDAHCQRLARRSGSVAIDPAQAPGGALFTTRGDVVMGLPLADTRFDSHVTGTIAETVVTQRFVNDFDAPIEAVYTFPLPHDGAVDRYAFRFAGREVRGVIERRAEAQARYDQAKRAGKTAALLEQERPNVFTQHLANLPPGAEIEVEIHVVQPLAPRSGRYELVLPTVVSPRYVPGQPVGHAGTGVLPDTDRVADGSRITPPVVPQGLRSCGDLHIAVTFDPGLPIDDLRATTHRVREHRDAAGPVVVLDEDYALLNRDFVLSWRRSAAQPRAMLLTEQRNGEQFFSLTIDPPATVDPDDAPPREIIFVLDASGSMNGEPIARAKATMRQLLLGLRPGDAFQVMRFSDRASGLGADLVPATDDNVAAALSYVDGLEGEGGTNMTDGVEAALGFPHDPERVRFVVFLTDGYIGNEAEVFALLRDRIGDARLFSIGIGASINRYLLDGMARTGRGDVAYLAPDDDWKPVVDRLYAQLDRPALTDLSIDFGRTEVEALAPALLPDLLLDRPVVVFGKLRGPVRDGIVVRGRRGRQHVDVPVVTSAAAIAQQDVSGVSSSWARTRIAELLLEPSYLRHSGPAARRIESQVVALSLRHAVLTEFTAFVAVDHTPHVDGRDTHTTVVQGVDATQGMAEQAVWGHVGHGGVGTLGHGSGSGSGGGGGSGAGYGRGSGAGFGGRGTRAPSIRMAKATVSGSLDTRIIRRIVRAHLAEVRACYNATLVHDPTAAGRVVMSFMIDGDGKVTVAAVRESEIADEALGKCLAAKILRWRFPVSADAGAAMVNYPFLFAVPEPDPADRRRRAGGG